MTPTKPLAQIESLPNDILREIISQVATSSRRDVRHFMQSSPELAKSAPDKQVYKRLNLKPFAKNPLWALNNYTQLMERCLESGNMEAHYIKGIQQYFQHNNTNIGLEHLKKSADGLYADSIYLYGIIMTCRGQLEEGRTYLDKLEWKKNTARGDRCWRHIKRSLRGMTFLRKRRYLTTIRNNKPTRLCNLNDMDTRCHKCYYYKQMLKFVNVRTT
ncbi:F-box protein [Cardamine amara subsp. amara]|uniref:F-box protein n=1 Tax=Cardamine amara subsp. amara TaxID=228776 RepID=A0ABD1A7H4_CARAN